MLPLLLGLLTGLFLARHFDISVYPLIGFALIGSLITLLLARFTSMHQLWMLGFLLSTTLCFWAYGQLRLPSTPNKLNLELPEREARLCIEVQTVTHSVDRYDKISGLARVLQAPENSRLNTGDRLHIHLPQKIKSDSTEKLIATIQQGIRIKVTGILTPIPDSPKENFNAYLKNIGVHYRLARTCNVQIVRPPTQFSQFRANMNRHFQKVLKLGTPANQPELANIYVTMLLGCKAELTETQSNRYRMTGTMHFFAISGLHIGVIATVIANCLHLMRVPRFLGPLIGIPLLYLYVEITGGSSSAVRAFSMIAFFWSSFAFNRQHTSFSALINSAIFVLAINPDQLWNLGFQLSYTVVGSILLLGLPLHQILKTRFEPYRWLPENSWKLRHRISTWMLDKFFQLFAISFSAWLASAPFCAVLFDFISPGTIVLNMLLVYLVAIVIISGIVSLTCSFIQILFLSEFINHSAWFAIYVMDRVVIFGTTLPNLNLSDKCFPPNLIYGILILYFVILLWLHYYPGKIATGYVALPIILILSGLSIGFWVYG